MGKARALTKVPKTNDYEYKNQVVIVGRCSGPGQEKVLPSGDKVVEFRLIVTRTEREGVDTLDIAAWSAKMRKVALTLEGD